MSDRSDSTPPSRLGEKVKTYVRKARRPEIILILVVIILLFGAKKLPDMARSLGKSARILKRRGQGDEERASPTIPLPPIPPTPSGRGRSATIQAAPGGGASSRPVHRADGHDRR